MARVEIVEQIILIGAIAALWPWVFGYREPWYQWGLLSLVALAMVAILVRKWRRMNQAIDEARASLASGTPTLPYMVSGGGAEKDQGKTVRGKTER